MSQNTITPDPQEPVAPVAHEAAPCTAAEPAATPDPAALAADESTIGTGTSMALGCIAGTVVLIIFGLLFLFISTLV